MACCDIARKRRRNLERFHQRSAERRAAGLCLKRGKREPAPDRSLCEPCLEKRRAADRARPTRLGAVVAGHARRILREIEDGEATGAAAHAGRTGRFRVTAPPVWMQAVVAPAVRAFHGAFPEVELGLRTTSWRESVRRLADGGSDLHCGGLDTGEALPAHLRRERFLDVTAGVVAARGHPLHAPGRRRPRDLVDWPWIDVDGPAGAAGGGQPSLAAVLDELHRQTGRRVRAVVRAASPGLALLAVGPWLAWLPLELIKRLPGAPLKALPLAFGRRRYHTGFVVRRAAEDLAPFRKLKDAMHAAALGRRVGPPE